MKKVFIIFLLASCQVNKQEQLHSKIEPALKKYVAAITPGKIDSLSIVKIDTLNDREIEFLKAVQYKNVVEELQAKFDEEIKDAKFYSQMQDISYSIHAANVLKDKREELTKLKDGIVLNDSLRIISFDKALRADTTNFLGYIARFRLKFSDTITLVQSSIDNGEVVITKDFKIMEKSSLIK